MFSANVWSDIWGPEASSLAVHGSGKQRADGRIESLWWESARDLKIGDRVLFRFEEGSTSLPAGQVFDDEPSLDATHDFSVLPSEEELLRLETMPARNAAVVWVVSVNDGAAIRVHPDSARQQMSLGLLWNEHHPDRLRVSLARSSLREAVARVTGEAILTECVAVDSRIEVVVDQA